MPPLPTDRRSVLAGCGALLLAGTARAAPERLPDMILRPGAVSRRLRPEPAGLAAGLGFDGLTAPPVIRKNSGEEVFLRLDNAWSEPSSLHCYGLHGFNAMDGAAGLTQAAIAPGSRFDYRFTPPCSGLHWLAPLTPGHAARQLDRGLAGLLIVGEPNPPEADAELVLALDDWRVLPDGSAAEGFGDPADAARSGRLGGVLTVNGVPGPTMLTLRPRARIRLRLVNIANARIMPLRFGGFGTAAVIAIDGQWVTPFDPLRKQVVLAPGARLEAMLDLPDREGDSAAVVIALGDGLPIVRVQAAGAPLPSRPPVAAVPPNALPAAIRLQQAIRATMTISGGLPAPQPGKPPATAAEIAAQFPEPARIWRINGGANAGFDGAPLFRARQGDPCVLAISNASAWAQVIHTHGHHFRYLHPFDDGWEPYWLDTLVVPPGQTIRVAFDAGTPGKWAVRSSIMEHFESGVASWFEIT